MATEGSIAQKYAAAAASAASYSAAWVLPRDRVLAFRSVRNIDSNASESYLQWLSAAQGAQAIEPMTPPFPVVKSAFMRMSDGGKMVRGVNSQQDGKDVPLLEVTGPDGAIVTRVDASQFHGKLCGDDWFGGCDWSRDERYVVYVAEPKKPKLTTFFDKSSSGGSNDEAGICKYEYQEDWGEKYTGTVNLVIAVCDTATGKVELVQGISAEVTPGQPCFTPDTTGVVYTAWKNNPRKLGMIYCYHRACGLFHADIRSITAAADSSTTPVHFCLSAESTVARSARFNPVGDRLVYLASTGLETHNGGIQLRALAWDGHVENLGTSRVVVDIIDYPLEGSGFPGLFAGNLPTRCFMADYACVVSTTWKSRQTAVTVDLESGAVTRLTDLPRAVSTPSAGEDWNNADDASVSVLDVVNGKILFAVSTPCVPARLGLFVVSDEGNQNVLAAPEATTMAVTTTVVPAEVHAGVQAAIRDIRWKIIEVTPEDDPRAKFEAILLLPAAQPGVTPPLVLTPHGGPHSASTTAYIHTYSFLTAVCGYAVLHVNYRGSIGFGQAPLSSLAGKIGTQDVHDLDLALKVVENLGVCDFSKLAMFGGSHGGFLTAHMIGQFPERFKAAAMRNPALNLPMMGTASDIPDWTVIESQGLGSYDFTNYRHATAAEMQRMYEVSPFSLADRVQTPTLICLGAKDRRVPYLQGVEYYHALKCRNVPTRMFVYPEDDHALDKPATEADAWIQVSQWFDQQI